MQAQGGQGRPSRGWAEWRLLTALCPPAAHSQGAAEAQVHHSLHQEDLLPHRAHRPLQALEVRGAWRGVQL